MPEAEVVIEAPQVDVVMASGEVASVVLVEPPEVEILAAVNIGAQGPQGDQGPQGPQGINGTPGGSYTHIQGVASAVWNINHGLGFFPNVTVVDSTNREVVGDVQYVDANNVTLTFAGAFSGKAYLS